MKLKKGIVALCWFQQVSLVAFSVSFQHWIVGRPKINRSISKIDQISSNALRALEPFGQRPASALTSASTSATTTCVGVNDLASLIYGFCGLASSTDAPSTLFVVTACLSVATIQ